MKKKLKQEKNLKGNVKRQNYIRKQSKKGNNGQTYILLSYE